MKLIKTLLTSKEQFLSKLFDGDVRVKSLLSLSMVTVIAATIWFGGPHLAWEDYHPLAQEQKRLYIIVVIYLLWLLKYLMLDLDTPTPSQFHDPATHKAVTILQKRFYGAMRFLRRTKILRQGKQIRLNQLPWYLLIGPQQAGKTALLAKSNVNFILQRQFQQQTTTDIKPSEHCDWWVTRDASIIDVPAKYLADTTRNHATPVLWDFYLHIVKDQRGKDAFNGIIIALPLPEIMQQANEKQYEAMLQHLFKRIHEFQSHFQEEIACYLLITKCDLLPGFTEFFAESGNDELTQAWGILLPQLNEKDKLQDAILTRFNALIKKLNQQLLWRLHQERNPLARPYIKDFPLQVERLKECLLGFIKKFTTENFKFYLKGIYLTSSQQEKPEEESPVIDESANTTQKSLQLFKEPAPDSRAFFIKQFITHALNSQQGLSASKLDPGAWKRRIAYAASLIIISLVTFVLAKDFDIGLKHTRTVQADFEKYELAIKDFHNPVEHLKETVELMNSLRQDANESRLKFNLVSLASFYSQKSKQKAYGVYKKALNDVLLLEVKNYLGEFIRTPVNKNTDSVYAVLKAYLMLSDSSRMDKAYFANTLRSIFPSNFTEKNTTELLYHLNLALSFPHQPMLLDTTLIEQTQRYLLSLQGVPLAYTILKNMNSNDVNGPINLGLAKGAKATLISQEFASEIPSMFTVRGFTNAFTQDTEIAAQEALNGNWVLGDNMTISRTREEVSALTEKLREAYVKDYIAKWESILSTIKLNTADNLQQTDNLILHLISNNSPLLQMLQTLHENTYFDPISTSSERLQNLGLLVDKSNAPQNLLYQILVGLQALHQYIQPVIVTDNQNKKAFEIVSKRMSMQDATDAVTQLRLIAQKSPEPIKAWLETITNDTWHYLMNDAIKYIDISWQEEVVNVYKTDIANRYPFSANQNTDVDIDKFIKFFGNPGIIVGFHKYYLDPFIDKTGAEWRWKEMDNEKLPIPDDVLLQVQQGLKIHHAFFPNDDAQPLVQFTIQPHNIDNKVASVKLKINDKQILNGFTKSKMPTTLSWPIDGRDKSTSLELAITGQKPINRQFSGDWGWFKLISQSFDSAVSRKQILLNFSQNGASAKYTVITSDKFNPFMSMNLKHFHLPLKLIKS